MEEVGEKIVHEYENVEGGGYSNIAMEARGKLVGVGVAGVRSRERRNSFRQAVEEHGGGENAEEAEGQDEGC